MWAAPTLPARLPAVAVITPTANGSCAARLLPAQHRPRDVRRAGCSPDTVVERRIGPLSHHPGARLLGPAAVCRGHPCGSPAGQTPGRRAVADCRLSGRLVLHARRQHLGPVLCRGDSQQSASATPPQTLTAGARCCRSEVTGTYAAASSPSAGATAAMPKALAAAREEARPPPLSDALVHLYLFEQSTQKNSIRFHSSPEYICRSADSISAAVLGRATPAGGAGTRRPCSFSPNQKTR